MAERGERKDDKEPEKFSGTGVVERAVNAIAEFISKEGLTGKAKQAADEAEKKRREI